MAKRLAMFKNSSMELKMNQLFRTVVVLALVSMAIGCGQAPPPAETGSATTSREEQLKRQLASLQKRYYSAEARLETLQHQLDNGNSEPFTSLVPVPNILDELYEFRIGSKSRRADTRRLHFLMESLIRQGDVSVRHMREFLNKMEDVDYAIHRDGEKEEDYAKRYRNLRATLNFSQPPTMRIALINALAEIGTSAAEAALAEVLAKTARGFEIAYTAKALRGWLGEDAYSEQALAAAHDLLSDPVEVPRGNHFDRVSKNYLFMVLDMYKDQTFIQTAQGMFINDDGRIDRTILSYFDNTGKEHSLNTIVQAFRSGRVHESDMDNLASVATKYVGKSPQADQLFRDIITGNQYNLETKRDAIQSLISSDGDQSTPGVPPNLLQARLDLINSIQFDESDLMGKGMQMLSMQLEAKLTGNKVDERKMYESSRRIFGELEKRERNAKRGAYTGNFKNARPTIVPAP